MDNFKAIETLHSGYRFRSRLEARWSVFFETLGIEYRYEPEGFDLDGVKYLPDFYLPSLQTWVEIKPDSPSREEREKVIRLCLATNQIVVLLCGDVWLDNSAFGFLSFDNETMTDIVEHYEKDVPLVDWITSSDCLIARYTGQKAWIDFDRGLVWSQVSWLECLLCGKINVNMMAVNYCSCEEKKASVSSPRLMDAYTAARSARFGRDGQS